MSDNYLEAEVVIDDKVIEELGPMEVVDPVWLSMMHVSNTDDYVEEMS